MASGVIVSAGRIRRAPLAGYLDRGTIPGVAAHLASGGIAVLPTDTIYGFHCSASIPEAITRMRDLKGRGAGVGFILLAADTVMADSVVARWPGSSRALLAGIWPAPLTAILPGRRTLDPNLAPRGSVAVRVPANRELRSLIRRLGEPVVSTSVNVSGRSPVTRIADARRLFPGLEAYISRRGRQSGSASTIVDFRFGTPRLVRAGAYPRRSGE
jgi:tRNA threonylcarbamoyl adenosine modification protein (Sua5/YciO/YrdC/YwlC family)